MASLTSGCPEASIWLRLPFYDTRGVPTLSPASLLQALISGALLGCFYVLMALGFSMILGVSRWLNLAHGDLVVLGGYVGYSVWATAGVHPVLLLPVAALALAPAALLWQWLSARTPEPKELSSLVLTFGLSLLVQTVMRAVWRGECRLISDSTLGATLPLGPLTPNRGRVLAAASALAVVGLLWLALTRTRWGQAVRATSIDPQAAALVGVDVNRARWSTFLLALGLAGVTGVLFATLHHAHPAAGVELTLMAIVLAIWARVGRLRSVLGAGVLPGIIEALTVTGWGPAWREPVVALMLLGSLLARAGGLARGYAH